MNYWRRRWVLLRQTKKKKTFWVKNFTFQFLKLFRNKILPKTVFPVAWPFSPFAQVSLMMVRTQFCLCLFHGTRVPGRTR
jgi:hypothetical protein